jgi:hypothetical protein
MGKSGSHHGFDEGLRDLRVDGITEGAQLIHSAGIFINQHGYAGFSRARLAVGAQEPFSSCAGPMR